MSGEEVRFLVAFVGLSGVFEVCGDVALLPRTTCSRSLSIKCSQGGFFSTLT